jgi:hypothetical protein
MKCMRLFGYATLLLLTLEAAVSAATPAATRRTDNVLLVMTDGLRWQEVFGGAEETLMTKEEGGVADVDALRGAYWRDTPEARREALMPFLWKVVARDGQIYGNQAKGSMAQVTNGMNFSYPGYNETLCGFADPRIDSNDKNLNPNVTVFEWLNRKPAYYGKVAAFGVWDVFPVTFNRQRCGFFVHAGYEPIEGKLTPQLQMLNTLRDETTRKWQSEPFDTFTFHLALAYLKEHKPKVFFLSLNETDAWGHEGRYDNYLTSAHRADAYLKTLWDTVQAMPEYQGKTSIVFVPDHGRGDAPVEWKNHGKKTARSEYIWMAFLGPDTPALGERSNVPAVTQSQVAATVAALLGENYPAAVPQAAQPVAAVLGEAQRTAQ